MRCRGTVMMDRVVVILLLAGILCLSGCNTMEGFGKDLKKLGGNIEKKADEKKAEEKK
jgi:predicted small secreted protein